MTEATYTEISCTRGIQDRFNEGPMEFKWSIGAPNVMIAAKSYFRVEMELYGAGAGTAKPKISEQIAFSDDACGSLFSNAYVKGGGQSISSCNQSLPQTSALKKRLSSSNGWAKSMGLGAWMSEADFDKRCLSVSNDNNPVAKSDTEMYKPVDATVTSFSDSECAIATNGTVTGTDTNFQTSDVGSTLCVDGVKYTITAQGNATTVTVSPAPIAAVTSSTNWYCVRRNQSRSSEGRNKIYGLYQPPCGFFDVDSPIPSGDFSVLLTPNAEYITSCVETQNPNFAATGATSVYKIKVTDIKFYLYTEKMSIPDKVEHLELMEINTQYKPYANSLQFSVESSTKALSFWLQDTKAGSDPSVPSSMFKTKDGKDLRLEYIQVTYANMTKTQTPQISRYEEGIGANDPNLNMLQQIYRDTYAQAGMDVDAVGCETFDSFVKRGILIHFDWSRDMNNKSTELQVQTRYAGVAPISTEANFYVASWNTRTTNVTHSNGQIVSVSSLQI